jgi:hypothetical protein
VCLDILEECNSSTQLPSVDRLGRFPGVLLFTSAPSSAGIGNAPYLEGNPQVGTASPRRLGWVYLGSGVANLDNSSISISPSRRFWKLNLRLRIAVHSSVPCSCQHLDPDWIGVDRSRAIAWKEGRIGIMTTYHFEALSLRFVDVAVFFSPSAS